MKYSMQVLALPVFAAVVSAFGQVLLKYAMQKHGPIVFSPGGIASLGTEPRLVAALSLYAVALLMWLHVLSKIPLSTAYPVLAVTYVLVPLLSIVFFGEHVNRGQMIGISLVLAGVALIGVSAGE
jgi:undecaprenyl phosphate-alpha-L-ara4N flippase subunit ArnE